MDSRRKHGGFSLVELTIVVAIIGLVMAGVFGVLSISIKSFQFTADQGTNIQLLRNTLNDVATELKNATSITAPPYVSGTPQSSASLDYVSPETTSPNRRIVVGTGAEAGNILIQDRSAANAVIKSFGQARASSITFERDAGNSRVFKVTIVFQSSAAGASATTLTTTATTLNP